MVRTLYLEKLDQIQTSYLVSGGELKHQFTDLAENLNALVWERYGVNLSHQNIRDIFFKVNLIHKSLLPEQCLEVSLTISTLDAIISLDTKIIDPPQIKATA